MLGNRNRLTKEDEFNEVKTRGKTTRSKSFSVIVYEKNDGTPPRFGFIVSTKIAKEAVIRNKIKRSLREAVRQRISTIMKGIDVVVVAGPAATKAYTQELMKEMEECNSCPA
jgi:ribonuclease P protein component